VNNGCTQAIQVSTIRKVMGVGWKKNSRKAKRSKKKFMPDEPPPPITFLMVDPSVTAEHKNFRGPILVSLATRLVIPCFYRTSSWGRPHYSLWGALAPLPPVLAVQYLLCSSSTSIYSLFQLILCKCNLGKGERGTSTDNEGRDQKKERKKRGEKKKERKIKKRKCLHG